MKLKEKIVQKVKKQPTISIKHHYLESIDELASTSNQDHNTTQPITNLTSIQTLPSLDSTIYRIRNKIINTSKASTRKEIIIDEKYQKTKVTNEKFLQLDLIDRSTDYRMLIFFTENFFKLMIESKLLVGDGTFKASPSQFSQVYTIHFQLGKFTLPAIYCLLPDKSKCSYINILSEMKKTTYNFSFRKFSFNCFNHSHLKIN